MTDTNPKKNYIGSFKVMSTVTINRILRYTPVKFYQEDKINGQGRGSAES